MRATATRLDALLPHLQVHTGVPDGSHWHRVADIDDERVASWLDTVETEQGRRDVASSFLGSWLASPVVTTTVAAVLLESRCPQVSPQTVFLRHHPGGWIDGIAFADSAYVVLPDDPAAADPQAIVVPDRAALYAHWARATTSVLTPLLDSVASQGRFGRRGLWANGVVDCAVATATGLSRRHPEDTDRLVAVTTALLDALDRLTRASSPRARLFPVLWREKTYLFDVKSACCLLYKTVLPHARQAGSYCTGCPLIGDDDRAARWRRWLGDTATP